MLKRYCVPPLILSLVLPVLVLNCKQYDKKNPVGNKIVLQVNDWTLTAEEFNRRIEKIEKWHNEYGKAEVAQKAVDISLRIGLLITEAYKRDLDKDKEIIDKALVTVAKEVYAEKYTIRSDELETVHRRQRQELYLGHVWVKINNQGVVSRIVQQLRRGASIETMAKYREAMSRPKEREQIVFEVKTVSGGDMVEDLEKVAYRLKLGQVKVVKTKSGYHILQLLGTKLKRGEVVSRAPEFLFSKFPDHKEGLFKTGSIDVRKSLRRAKIREEGGLDIDRIKEEGKLEINKRMLDNISFPPKFPMNEIKEPEDSQVVAIVLSQKIMVSELKSKISKSPPRILAKFENKYTRDTAVRKLLETEVLYRETRRGNKERKLIEKLLRTNTRVEKDNIIEALKGLAVIEKLNGKNSVKIDRTILHAITIVSPGHPKNSTILATFDGGKITVGRFREAINGLPMEVKPHLNDLRNRREFLEYVVFSKFLPLSEDAQILQINGDILEAISYKPMAYEPFVNVRTEFEATDLHIFSEIEKIQVPDYSEPIATFGEVSLTVGQLEEDVSSMSDEEKAAFNDINARAMIVENLLIEEAWLREADRLKLGKGFAMKQEKERLMIEKLYNLEIVDRVVIADDEIEKYFPYTQFSEEKIKRMDDKTKRDFALIMKRDKVFKKYLQQLRARVTIALDQDELAKWGIKRPELAQ